MVSHHHVIIAGANKCGTTSLFRYLSAHPGVTGSIIKEAGFFHRELPPGESDSLRAYLDLFGPFVDPSQVLLEGTPTYLDGGLDIAIRIRETLDNVRLIFLLREPADRLASFFRSKQGLKTSPTYGLSFQEFVTACIEAQRPGAELRSARQKQLLHQWTKGRYQANLEAYLEIFDAQDMLILFYDDLRSDSRSLAARAAAFAGLDASFFVDHSFSIENQSRTHRNDSLRTWATQANHRLEPYLNRFPSLRRLARATYNFANASTRRPLPPPEHVLIRIREIHANDNARLAELLEGRFGLSELPDWLSPAGTTTAA